MTSKTTSTNETSGLIRRRSSFFSPSPTPEAPDHQKVLAFSQDNRHFSLLRNLHMADFITLLNGACGFNSVISSLKYAQTGDTTFAVRAMFLVPLGLFFDFMDGRVARWRNKSSLMGQELDSLADLVSFGVAPGLLAYVLGFQTVADQVALTVFVLCGLTRLARFNVTVANVPKDAHGKSKYFEGTPIPSTLLLVGLMYFWTKKDWILDDLPFGTVGYGIFEVHPLVALFVISGSAMISKSLHVPKP